MTATTLTKQELAEQIAVDRRAAVQEHTRWGLRCCSPDGAFREWFVSARHQARTGLMHRAINLETFYTDADTRWCKARAAEGACVRVDKAGRIPVQTEEDEDLPLEP